MIAARFIPHGADEETLSDAVNRSLHEGLIPCVPNNTRIEREFRVTFFNPAHIPPGYSRLAIRIKSPTHGEMELVPCPA